MLARLARYPFKLFCRYNIPLAKLEGWFVERLRTHSLTGRLDVVESPASVALLRRVQTDSRIFGFGVEVIAPPDPYRKSVDACRQLLRKVLRAAKAARLRHLRCDVVNEHTALIHALQRTGFKPIDATLVLSLDLSRLELYGENTVSARRAELPDLVPASNLAADVLSGAGITRYARDPLLSGGAADVYRAMMQAAFKGQIFVAGRRPIGFVTAKLPDEETSRRLGVRVGCLPLSGLSAKHPGQGVYSALLDHALTWLKGNGAPFAEVAARGCSTPTRPSTSAVSAKPSRTAGGDAPRLREQKNRSGERRPQTQQCRREHGNARPGFAPLQPESAGSEH